MSTKLITFVGLVIVSFTLITLIPSKTYIVVSIAKADNKPKVLTAQYVKAYVREQALAYGVNPIKSDWIISHESQYCQNVIGYEPNGSISYGCWQFNNNNDSFNLECAMDLECSTHLAMDWIVKGKINRWTTWSMRKEWYDNAPD